MMTDIDVRPLDEEYLSDLYAMAKTPATASSQRKASMEKQLSDQIEQITNMTESYHNMLSSQYSQYLSDKGRKVHTPQYTIPPTMLGCTTQSPSIHHYTTPPTISAYTTPPTIPACTASTTLPAYTTPPTIPAYATPPTIPAYTTPPTIPAYTTLPTIPAYTTPPTIPAYTTPPTIPAYATRPTTHVPVYTTPPTITAYATPPTIPVYTTPPTIPTYITTHTIPAYTTSSTMPAYNTTHTVPAYTTPPTMPAYTTSSTIPAYRTPHTIPVHTTTHTIPIYTTTPTIPAFTFPSTIHSYTTPPTTTATAHNMMYNFPLPYIPNNVNHSIPHSATTHVDPFSNVRRREKEPDKFDGRTVEWRDYIVHFEQVAMWNHWSETEKAQQLAISLRGQAQKLLGDLNPIEIQSYENLKNTLSQRYDPQERGVAHKCEFRNRKRSKNETPADYGYALRRIACLAFSDIPYQFREVNVLEQF
ncbi:MAG: hypothetical protein ABW185_28000 [Sedimenticola sp.]